VARRRDLGDSARVPTVTGVDFLTVFVTDFPAARRFYGGLLGLEQSQDYDRIPGGEFETGNLTLQIIDAVAVGRASFSPSTHPLALHVGDVAAARAELEAEGVAFMGDTIDSGVCHMAIFPDPDGNLLMFHHRYAPADPPPGD
jgi:catechol 2,3-dioxygenase-like lactoylglutathione lyase family enzyme